jgi:hypothetical protein
VVRNLTWYVVTTVALWLQVLLAIPILVLFHGTTATVVALIWGAMTLFAAWSWVFARWRVVLAPVVTIAVFVVALAVGSR